MDGLVEDFLIESRLFSGRTGGLTGILYIEDFDAQSSPPVHDNVSSISAEASSPPILPADLEAAREQGRVEGLQAALDDAGLLQQQVHAAAIQSLTDELRAARSLLEQVATRQADNCVRMVLAILQTALPSMMAQHAASEVVRLAQALVPALTHCPGLQVSVHPILADVLAETIAQCHAGCSTGVVVTADSALAAGDIRMTWNGGEARRDCAAIWNLIRDSLAPLHLPSLEEIRHVD